MFDSVRTSLTMDAQDANHNESIIIIIAILNVHTDVCVEICCLVAGWVVGLLNKAGFPQVISVCVCVPSCSSRL